MPKSNVVMVFSRVNSINSITLLTYTIFLLRLLGDSILRHIVETFTQTI